MFRVGLEQFRPDGKGGCICSNCMGIYLKVLHLLYKKEITCTLQPRFCKVDLMLNALIQLKIIQY